jgi:hypothetical protein
LYLNVMSVVFPNPSMRRRPVIVSAPRLLGMPVLLHMLLCCACTFYSIHSPLTVRLPEAPAHWQQAFPELSYRIFFPTNDSGGFAERRVDGDARVTIPFPKTLYLPVLAYPDLPGRSIDLPPAGGVYPLDSDTVAESISLSWQRGAAAEVLKRLWEQGVDCSTINVPRLCGEISTRSQGDPWALDLDRICDRLAAEEFRLTDIRLAPSRNLLLEPGTGNWFLESPFRFQISAETDGSLLLQNVPLGAHTLFENPPEARYFLWVQEGTTLMIRL